jgi:hypothetical protein
MGFVAGDSNLYRYVGNDATNLTDPSGLEPPPWWIKGGVEVSTWVPVVRPGEGSAQRPPSYNSPFVQFIRKRVAALQLLLRSTLDTLLTPAATAGRFLIKTGDEAIAKLHQQFKAFLNYALVENIKAWLNLEVGINDVKILKVAKQPDPFPIPGAPRMEGDIYLFTLWIKSSKLIVTIATYLDADLKVPQGGILAARRVGDVINTKSIGPMLTIEIRRK